MKDINRTIRKILDLDTGEFLDVKEIFQTIVNKDDYLTLRREIHKRNRQNEPHYLCEFCGTRLELSCYPDQKGDHSFFFRHKKDPGESRCPIRTNSGLTREEIEKIQYELKKESMPHIELKRLMSDIIRRFIDPHVITDSKFILDKDNHLERRKPDISFIVEDKRYVIEIQLNNTFQDVIAAREEFYSRNGISLLWVFHKFNPIGFNSISAKDIYVPNYNNAFVFDETMYKASLAAETLKLQVYFKDYDLEDGNIVEIWKEDVATHLKLQVDGATQRPFFFDSPGKRRSVEAEIAELQVARERKMHHEASKLVLEEVKSFISAFRRNDLLPYRPWMQKVKRLDSGALKILNDELGIRFWKDADGKNVVQYLVKKGGHDQLLRFFLETTEIEIELQSELVEETTLMSILAAKENSPFYAGDLLVALFNRGYRLSGYEKNHILQTNSAIEAKEQLMFFQYLECSAGLEMSKSIMKDFKHFLVIESAKAGHLVVLGNEKQTILWLGNLAFDQYKQHWVYFNIAFEHFGFLAKIWLEDKNGSFRNHYIKAKEQQAVRDIDFEGAVIAIFPELKDRIHQEFEPR